MLIYGLGLTESHWKVIFQNIQQPLIQKVKARLLSHREIEPHAIINTCDDISKSAPALFLLTPQGFRAFTDCLFFLSQLQMRLSNHPTQYGLIVETMEKDLFPFLSYNPEITLANKMQFMVSDAMLLRDDTIHRFPKIQIDPTVSRLEYQGYNNVVNQAIEEIPENRLISLNQIQTVYTNEQAHAFETWLVDFLKHQENQVDIEQIRGVLKEAQGASLFPGIPIDRIHSLNMGDIHLDYVLSFKKLNRHSAAFMEMIKSLQAYQANPLPKQPEQQSLLPIRCLGNISIINQLTEHFLTQWGFDNIRFIDHLPSGIHTLEDTLKWVQLNPFLDITLQGAFLDLHVPIQKILQPLAFFVEVEQLKMVPDFSSEAIAHVELETQRDQLIKQEKRVINEKNLAQNKCLLLSQEEDILAKTTQVAQRLIQYLANCFFYEEVLSDVHHLETPQVLFFCEEQEQAYELNQKLVHIPKKLWINPFDYEDADQFYQLNIETIQPYAENGIIVITPESIKHFEDLNNQIFERYHEVTKESVLQKKVTEQAQNELESLQKQKNNLAIRWIYTSLEHLLKSHESTLREIPT